MRWVLIFFIRIYQATLSKLIGRCCRFTPTCSQYAIDALKERGFLEGSLLATWRILRCNPFMKGGFDPVENSPRLNLNDYVKNFWFLGMLAILFIVVFSFDIEGDWVVTAKGSISYIVAVNMFLMSFSLKPEMILSGAMNFRGQITAFLSSFGFMPALSLLIGIIFFSSHTDIDKGLFIGTLVAASVPTTLVSAAIWARLSGGNDAFSMVFTLISNGFGVVLTPLIIAILLSFQTDVFQTSSMPVGEMVLKLFYIVIIPVTLGQAVRFFAKDWPVKLKPVTGKICQMLVLLVIFFAIADVKCKMAEAAGCGLGTFIKLSLAMIALHSVAFFVCYFVGKLIKMKREDVIALTFSGSQKTLQVGIYIAAYVSLLPEFSGLYLITFPMIFLHATQLAVDVIFIELFKRNRL